MINPLFLPELREMLAEKNTQELNEFCDALHPARTADFMQGLSADESWEVLGYANLDNRAEIFRYFELPAQVDIAESQDRDAVAELLAELPADDRVDLLNEVDPAVVEELMPLIPAEERREVLHLQSYPEGTAGAVMTTEVAKLEEHLTVREAMTELQRLSEEFETIYYLYVVDEYDHLRGLVSARQLLTSLGRPETTLGDLMETGLVTAEVIDDQEEVAQKVARYDLLAIPVVDLQRKLLGIITYDDVIDVVVEEATEDAHRSAAVMPLDESYLHTSILTLAWKRGAWLAVLLVGALLTATVLRGYDARLGEWTWLVLLLPLVLSSGGNTGNQSATLIITGLNSGNIQCANWGTVLRRELLVGILLGSILGMLGMAAACTVTTEARQPQGIYIIPLTLMFVAVFGSLTGAALPLIFRRIGLDPALMSNPFVAGIMDVVGILTYMNIAVLFLA